MHTQTRVTILCRLMIPRIRRRGVQTPTILLARHSQKQRQNWLSNSEFQQSSLKVHNDNLPTHFLPVPKIYYIPLHMQKRLY